MDAAFFNNLVSSIDFTMMVRLIVSAIFGGIVGMERGSGDRPAGFRTHILVCAGSTLIMLVSLSGFDGFDAQPFEYPRNRDSARIAAQVVSGIGAMTTLDEHGSVGFPGKQLRRPHHALVVGDGKTAQDLGLGHVRGDNVSQGHQVRDQRIDSLLLDEARAAGGHHDRVDHHVARLMETQTLCDDVDDLGGGYHAYLHRIRADILEHRIDLRADHFRRGILHGANAAGVLRRDGGDNRFRV